MDERAHAHSLPAERRHLCHELSEPEARVFALKRGDVGISVRRTACGPHQAVEIGVPRRRPRCVLFRASPGAGNGR